jgi:5-carboxyvanillate decarboxylase
MGLTTRRKRVPQRRSRTGAATGGRGYRRIATEEAWITPEIFSLYRKLIAENSSSDPGFLAMWGYIGSNSETVSRLLDLGDKRIGDMDAAGIDLQLLLLTSPGVQVFSATTAKALAADSNDRLAEACRNHPDRFAGLAAIAPQDPPAAARELERGMRKLGLKGAVINSHTQGEFLDDPKYWDIFEAAESLDAAIYIHPNTPPADMIGPYLKRQLHMAILGFGHEVSLHVLGLMRAGVFDRFPKLKIVIGHAGEGLPYWLYRMDYMSNIPGFAPKKLKLKPSGYMKRNIWVTTSGMPWAPAITMAMSVLGSDRVLYAMDYPYQYVADEVTATDRFPISRADLKRLYQTNAERIFHLRMT